MISFEPIVRARRVVIAAFVVAAALAAPGLLQLRMDNSAEGFFVGNDEALETFRRLEESFGRDRGLRLVIESDRLWTPAALEAIAALELELAVADGGLGGVYAAAGPVRHHRWHLGRWPPADPAALRRLATVDELDRDAGWVRADGEAVSVLVGLFDMLPQRQALTLAAIDERMSSLQASLNALSPDNAPSSSVYAVGLPMLSRAVDRGQLRVIRVVLPLLALVAAALLAFLFRTVAGVLLPFALVALTQVVLFGLIGYAGERIDFITLLLAPLTLVVTLATGVHVLAYHQRLLAGGLAHEAATLETFRVKAWPVLWTGITTCAGFASLAISDMPPVRALGLWTAFAIAFMTLAALSFYPALLSVVGSRAGAAASAFSAMPPTAVMRGVRRAIAQPRTVYLGFGAIAVVAALGLPRLHIDTGVLSYFDPAHPERARVERLERAGMPAASASLLIEGARQPIDFNDTAVLQRLSTLTDRLRAEPLVDGALSAGDLVADVALHLRAGPDAPAANVASGDPATPGAGELAAAHEHMANVADLRDLLGAVVAEGGERARVVLFTPMRGFRALDPVYRAAVEAAREAFPGARVELTGEYPLVITAQRSLLRTVVLSLLATFSVIAVALRLLLASTSLTLRSLLPSVWPVLLVLGAMGWARIPIDATTVMVAAVVLGLAVDDTLHTLGHLRYRVAGSADGHADHATVESPAEVADRAAVESTAVVAHRAAIESGMAEVAGGHAITSLILCLGFLVPMSSELVPVARFGMLAALAVAAALAADLLLVPALLAGAPAGTLQLLSPRRRGGGDEGG